MKKVFILVHGEARRRALDFVKNAPNEYVVTIEEPKRNSDQNALIHARLTEVGETLGWIWNGVEVDLDDLKTIFMAAYKKATTGSVRFAIGIDGQPVILDWRTRKLTKRECSEFMEYVNAYMADKE